MQIHGLIIQTMNLMGYQNTLKGVCNEISHMYVWAEVNNQTEHLNSIIEMIGQYDSPASLEADIVSAKKANAEIARLRNKQEENNNKEIPQLTDKQKSLLEVNTIFDSIQLYQNSKYHNDLYDSDSDYQQSCVELLIYYTHLLIIKNTILSF